MRAAMQVSEPIRHTRLFRTLREKHGIFIHLEDSRRTYWGIVAYLAVPSESKPDVDASPWLSKGHPPVVELLSNIPKGAVNSVKERVRKWLAEVHGIKLGRVQPLSHGQFVDYIVANKISDNHPILAPGAARLGQNRAGARILFQALQGHSDAAGNRVGHPSVHG